MPDQRPYATLLAKGEDRRQRILAVAQRLLTRHGGRGTTLGQIAQEAGVSPAGLLHHFESKEQLLSAVLDVRDADDEANADRSGDILEELVKVTERFRRAPGLVGIFTVLLSENLDPEAPLHGRFLRRYRAAVETVAAGIRRGQSAGQYRADVDPVVKATEIVAFLYGMETSWLLDPSIPLTEVFREYTGSLARQLMASPARDLGSHVRLDPDGTALSADPVADWARSGVVTLTGRAEGAPLVPPGRAATVAAELADRFAAATGVQVDGPQILAERAAYTGHRRRGAISAGGACRLLPTADGWAAVSCARPDDAALLGALAGEETGNDPWPVVARWLREHTGAELAERAELLSIAASPVTPVTPSGPVAPVVRLAEPSRPLTGLLVADFSVLWAGPLCAHLLGLAGARVVKIETPGRPDGARAGNAAFYRLLHAGHRCVTLDPRTSSGRAEMAALVRAAGIVIESSRPRALARFGLDAEGAAAEGTAWVSITAYGRASDRVGFGDDVAAGAGLVARDADGLPLFAGDAIADPLAGLTAAAAAACAPAAGALLDIAMSDVVAATLDPADALEPSLAARRDGDGWVVDSAGGAVPVAPPRRVTRARR